MLRYLSPTSLSCGNRVTKIFIAVIDWRVVRCYEAFILQAVAKYLLLNSTTCELFDFAHTLQARFSNQHPEIRFR